MANLNGSARHGHIHLVLVPGFGAFDALGQVEYYAGVTGVFDDWRRRHRPAPQVTLHYFDNLPTAAVTTRAVRLHRYLAKRIARGEILENDRIVLVGHSTGGLDIRQLIWDLAKAVNRRLQIDGREQVKSKDIRDRLHKVVFLSVPHWGTNIADWVQSYPNLRKLIVSELRSAVRGSQLRLLDVFESGLAGAAASLTNAEMLLALEDALTEANEHYGTPSPLRTADAHEAYADLALYFRQMCSDFHAIHDLSCKLRDPDHKSPAHFTANERQREQEFWRQKPAIKARSYATVGCRPFGFPEGEPAPTWEMTNPISDLGILIEPGSKTDLSYRMCYRACAGGPFRIPKNLRTRFEIMPPAPPLPLDHWDNDGIVNTASMLWPNGKNVLVMADHLDIVGHYHLVKAPKERLNGHLPARQFLAYDVLHSWPRFTKARFELIWKEIFEFAIT
jgi:hypothetical protein